MFIYTIEALCATGHSGIEWHIHCIRYMCMYIHLSLFQVLLTVQLVANLPSTKLNQQNTDDYIGKLITSDVSFYVFLHINKFWLHCIALYCPVLHCVALYCTVLHCIEVHPSPMEHFVVKKIVLSTCILCNFQWTEFQSPGDSYRHWGELAVYDFCSWIY